MFITGLAPFNLTMDEYEDALLQYVYAMEKILLVDEKEGLADKIALRCAYLISLDDDDRRKQVYRQVKKIYDQRSKIVHGASSTNNQVSLDDVRDILRKLLVTTLSFRMSFAKDKDWQEALRYLPVSQAPIVFSSIALTAMNRRMPTSVANGWCVNFGSLRSR